MWRKHCGITEGRIHSAGRQARKEGNFRETSVLNRVVKAKSASGSGAWKGGSRLPDGCIEKLQSKQACS